MTAREGPPGKERPGAHHSAGPIRKSGPHQNHQPPSAYNRSQHCGGYAGAWREGFAAGFLDGLRLAARRLPPEVWPVLEELASAYALCGSDG